MLTLMFVDFFTHGFLKHVSHVEWLWRCEAEYIGTNPQMMRVCLATTVLSLWFLLPYRHF